MKDPTPRGFAPALIKTATTYGCIQRTVDLPLAVLASSSIRHTQHARARTHTRPSPLLYNNVIVLSFFFFFFFLWISTCLFLCIDVARYGRSPEPSRFFFSAPRKKRNRKYLRVRLPLHSNASHSSCIKANNNLMRTCFYVVLTVSVIGVELSTSHMHVSRTILSLRISPPFIHFHVKKKKKTRSRRNPPTETP